MPPTTELEAESVSVAEPEPVMVAGEKLAVIPCGRRFALNVTVPANPASGFKVTVQVRLLPATIVWLQGVEIVKSAVPAFVGYTPRNLAFLTQRISASKIAVPPCEPCAMFMLAMIAKVAGPKFAIGIQPG